jgi:hypothetical protein
MGGGIRGFGQNLMETARDMGKKTTVGLGLKDKPSCDIKGAPANPTADIDYSDLPKDAEGSARIQADAAAAHICKLEGDIEKLKADGNYAEAAQLSKELTQAKEALTEFKYQIETSGAKIGATLALGIVFPPLGIIAGLVQGGTDQRADMDKVNAASDQLKFDAPDATNTEDLDPKFLDIANAKGQMPMVEAKTQEQITQGHLDTIAEQAGTAGTESTGGTEGSKETDGAKSDEDIANDRGAELLNEGGGAIRDAMKSDPEGFAKMLTDMDPSLAGAMMNEMQNHMQAINRAWSSISNMEKAEHDTQKAIISNLRV